MGKTIYGKYLGGVGNIRVYLPICVAKEVWVSMSYPLQDTFSLPFIQS